MQICRKWIYNGIAAAAAAVSHRDLIFYFDIFEAVVPSHSYHFRTHLQVDHILFIDKWNISPLCAFKIFFSSILFSSLQNILGSSCDGDEPFLKIIVFWKFSF